MCLTISGSNELSYDILRMYGEFATPGLIDNLVYDVIPLVPSATGNVTVNASLYDVQCMLTQPDNSTLSVPGDLHVTTSGWALEFEEPCMSCNIALWKMLNKLQIMVI